MRDEPSKYAMLRLADDYDRQAEEAEKGAGAARKGIM
jgi:hypothetical protein